MADDEALALVCEDWLRRLTRDGAPSPVPRVIAELTRIALTAPGLAARCPALLRTIGPRVAFQVNAEAIALRASEMAPITGRATELTPRQAARLLAVKPDTVRWLLRRGLLTGRRTERGWLVDMASVRRYGQRRRDREQDAA